jgi:hypothetical protein
MATEKTKRTKKDQEVTKPMSLQEIGNHLGCVKPPEEMGRMFAKIEEEPISEYNLAEIERVLADLAEWETNIRAYCRHPEIRIIRVVGRCIKNPNATIEMALKLGYLAPWGLIENPSFGLWMIENPDFFNMIPARLYERLLWHINKNIYPNFIETQNTNASLFLSIAKDRYSRQFKNAWNLRMHSPREAASIDVCLNLINCTYEVLASYKNAKGNEKDHILGVLQRTSRRNWQTSPRQPEQFGYFASIFEW